MYVTLQLNKNVKKISKSKLRRGRPLMSSNVWVLMHESWSRISCSLNRKDTLISTFGWISLLRGRKRTTRQVDQSQSMRNTFSSVSLSKNSKRTKSFRNVPLLGGWQKINNLVWARREEIALDLRFQRVRKAQVLILVMDYYHHLALVTLPNFKWTKSWRPLLTIKSSYKESHQEII